MANYIPYIGSKGRFKFKEPFDKELNSNTVYTVASIKSFDNIIDSGIDVYKEIYEPNGLTEEDFTKAYTNGKVNIIELIDETGKYFNVPSDYFLSVPDINGVLYRDKMLVADLGYLPDNYEFSELKKIITDVIRLNVGVDVETKVVDASPTVMLTKEQDALHSKDRLTIIQSEDNIYYKYKDCSEKVERASSIINGLEKALNELNNK